MIPVDFQWKQYLRWPNTSTSFKNIYIPFLTSQIFLLNFSSGIFALSAKSYLIHTRIPRYNSTKFLVICLQGSIHMLFYVAIETTITQKQQLNVDESLVMSIYWCDQTDYVFTVNLIVVLPDISRFSYVTAYIKWLHCSDKGSQWEEINHCFFHTDNDANSWNDWYSRSQKLQY